MLFDFFLTCEQTMGNHLSYEDCHCQLFDVFLQLCLGIMDYLLQQNYQCKMNSIKTDHNNIYNLEMYWYLLDKKRQVIKQTIYDDMIMMFAFHQTNTAYLHFFNSASSQTTIHMQTCRSTHYPDSEPTCLCSFFLMLCAQQRSNKYQFYYHSFDTVGVRTQDLLHTRQIGTITPPIW